MSVAFVFPGQGSQQVGMMAGFADQRAVRDTFAEASDALGEDLWKLVDEGPADALGLTRNTQPVMLAAGVAVWRAWQAAHGPAPVYMAGHSLGEYSALVAAGALAFRDAVPLVRFRAEAMQDAVPAGEGAMATERTEMAQELEIARNRLANGAGRILLLKRPKLFHVETENMGPSLSGKAPEHARRRVRPSAAPPAPPGRVRDSGGKRPIH